MPQEEEIKREFRWYLYQNAFWEKTILFEKMHVIEIFDNRPYWFRTNSNQNAIISPVLFMFACVWFAERDTEEENDTFNAQFRFILRTRMLTLIFHSVLV